jgi:hypothetical protein
MHTGNYNTIILNHTIGINEAGPSLPNDIVYNLPDDYSTIKMPMFGTPCLVCGKDVAVSMWQSGSAICDECKQAIAWAKEKMKIETPSVEVE